MNFKENFKIPFLSLIATIIIVVVAVLMADLLYSPKKMLKRGYEIIISADGKVAPKKEEKVVDIATLLKLANIDNGKKIFKKCSTCHMAEKGAGNKVGPNLFGVVNRKKASTAFAYSDAMMKKGGNWSVEDLNQFITKPKDFVNGTKMGFAGLKKPQDRADVIKYLESIR